MRKHKKARLLTMDELHSRPCEVDGVPALFHRWADADETLLTFNASHPCNSTTEVIRKTLALVEYRDGTVHLVQPELVHFTDKEGGHVQR